MSLLMLLLQILLFRCTGKNNKRTVAYLHVRYYGIPTAETNVLTKLANVKELSVAFTLDD